MSKLPIGKNNGDQTVHLTDGLWRIVTYHYGATHNYRSIQHHCEEYGASASARKNWVGMYYLWPVSDAKCYICNTCPPDGLQAVFGMMGDEAENDT